MDRTTIIIAFAALVLAVLYLYRENQKLKVVPEVSKKKGVSFAQPLEEKADEKTIPQEQAE